MKEIALQIIKDQKDNKLNTLREYLQNYLLFLMQKSKMSSGTYFLGGTALRFLYQIRRYSQDLDFSVDNNWQPSDLDNYMKKLEIALEKAGYRFSITVKDQATVQKAIISFDDLLYESGLTQQKNQKLSIHLELDFKPPAGWKSEKTVVNLFMPVLLQHYDLPSLFAGKLHAVLTRKYTKGRDIFDLFWYRSKWKNMLPNFTLLNNALTQTEGEYITISKSNWLRILSEKIHSLEWQMVIRDVSPFLEYRDDFYTFTKENLLTLHHPKNK